MANQRTAGLFTKRPTGIRSGGLTEPHAADADGGICRGLCGPAFCIAWNLRAGYNWITLRPPTSLVENSPFRQRSVVKSDSLRSDAQGNNSRILEVARDALAADPNASLNSIAKEAGVGAGTLYRHFPSRESLVLGVYRKEIDTLVALAPTLLPSMRLFSPFAAGATAWQNSER